MLLPPELVTCTHLEGMHSLWYNENKPKGYSNVPHVCKGPRSTSCCTLHKVEFLSEKKLEL